MNLLQYLAVLDEEAMEVFIINEIRRGGYGIGLRRKPTNREDAEQICNELNKLINDYLDGKFTEA